MPEGERAAAVGRKRVGRLRCAERGRGGRRAGRGAGQASCDAGARGRRRTLCLHICGIAHKKTGIPHFDNKWRIEETVRDLRFPSHVILRPVLFMENLLAPFSLQASTLAWALGPGTKLQMIAVDDIGWFGARAFTDVAALNRREIDLAGDVRTMPEAAEILTGTLGRPMRSRRRQ
jgi:uncharacterized protein YbjT (DUF2867 family)